MADQDTPLRASVSEASVASGSITVMMVDALRGTKPWVLFIGILLFVGAAFSVIGGLGMMAGSAMMGAASRGAPPALFVGMGAVYLVIALVYVFLGLYLVKYSSAIGRLVSGGQSGDMEDALRQQRKFWTLAGILSLIMLAFAVLGILAAIAIPLFMR